MGNLRRTFSRETPMGLERNWGHRLSPAEAPYSPQLDDRRAEGGAATWLDGVMIDARR
ncbi:MAG: hypothetical protein LJE69_12420 [Thiohalocapsa sp.]|uniref:hypothetical protein n=1 Tax=Thiohalocapsa sp. TaxID=2497641 RepID=UPI0025E0FEB1|nr:hypothetical protein [Thiohalocapsa sp.]MCG6942041.1 hypothetical protein [Thiohalocapsa sp.]